MTIRVSDLGITRYDSYGTASKVGYVSYNERLNQNPVKKVDPVTLSASDERSVTRESSRDFVSGSTPAYTVDFSSGGMTALKSFKLLRENADKLAAYTEDEDSDRIASVDKKDAYEDEGYGVSVKQNDKKVPEAEKNNNTPSGRRISGIGTGSVKQTQAARAYEYQMSFNSAVNM